MHGLLKRIRSSAAWRARRIRRALYHREEVCFWAGDAEDAAWYPDLGKLAEIARAIGLQAREATADDLPLLRRYHDRVGRPLGPRRVRKMRERWGHDSKCYIALDKQQEIVAYLWTAYQDHYVEAVGEVLQVRPWEMVLFDADTRPDRRGSMGFVACACASLADGVRRGRRRVISWTTPELFEEFQRVHWWTGLGTLKVIRRDNCRRVCGLLLKRTVDVEGEEGDETSAEDAP